MNNLLQIRRTKIAIGFLLLAFFGTSASAYLGSDVHFSQTEPKDENAIEHTCYASSAPALVFDQVYDLDEFLMLRNSAECRKAYSWEFCTTHLVRSRDCKLLTSFDSSDIEERSDFGTMALILSYSIGEFPNGGKLLRLLGHPSLNQRLLWVDAYKGDLFIVMRGSYFFRFEAANRKPPPD